jgi:EAL domain-containing protein (putative c-di-GMP-specific phosphodiesterase class I)/GGDEF domain-containing protein
MAEFMNAEPLTELHKSEFELRIRQAIISAKYTVPQVAVLLFSFDGALHGLTDDDGSAATFHSSVSMRLRSGLRDSDTVAVLHAGQIGILLQSVLGPQDLELVINRLLLRLAEPVQIEDRICPITSRIGAALSPEHGETVETLLDHARRDLQKARTAQQPYTLDTAQPRSLITARQWMGELRQAIVKDQLFLTYQPKVSLRHQLITGVEVLVRWQHPEHGIIVPDQFIPLAERTGLIIPMTLWILQQSLLQCRLWNEIGLDIRVAVNLSMANLESQELPDQIAALLRDSKVSPERLELEITETSIMADPQRVIRTLGQIREFGVTFSIDDFGTGYSSFAYLNKLPVSCIKIDKSFVQNMEANRDNSVIVKSIIDLGHNLGLKVVAEGVESEESKNLLQVFLCDEGQGYHFCRPVTADNMTQFLLAPPETVTNRIGNLPGNWQALDRSY